jgi:hypothetical protein
MFRTIYPNRWFIWTIVIIFAAFIYVGGAIVQFAIEQRSEGELIAATPIPHRAKKAVDIDTSTWKTYRNEKYGFEFKYQKDFSIKELALGEPLGGDYDLYFWAERKTIDKFNQDNFERGTSRGDLNGFPAMESMQTGTLCIYNKLAHCFYGFVDNKEPRIFLSTLKFFEPTGQ